MDSGAGEDDREFGGVASCLVSGLEYFFGGHRVPSCNRQRAARALIAVTRLSRSSVGDVANVKEGVYYIDPFGEKRVLHNSLV